MAIGVGNVPQLTPSFVDGFFKIAFQAGRNATPLLNEFLAFDGINGLPKMYPSRVVSVDNLLNIETLASLMATPYALPEVADLPKVGQVEMRALYTHQHLMIQPDFIVALRQLGANPGSEVTDATVAAKMQEYASYLRAHSVRTFELWCANLLQGGNFNQVVSGVTQQVQTGITAANIGGNFATQTTNIPGLVAAAARAHEDQSGNPVDLIIWPNIAREYFAKNDYIQAWVIRQQGMTDGIIDAIPGPMKSSAYAGAREIFHKTFYRTSPSASPTKMWSDTKMTMISLNRESRTLMAGTHPLVNPDDYSIANQEPWLRHIWKENRSGEIGIREVGTMMFGLGDIKQITVWNLNA